MLDWTLSMRWEKRLERSVRRDSVWEGSSPGRLEVEVEMEEEKEEDEEKVGDDVEDASLGVNCDSDDEGTR